MNLERDSLKENICLMSASTRQRRSSVLSQQFLHRLSLSFDCEGDGSVRQECPQILDFREEIRIGLPARVSKQPELISNFEHVPALSNDTCHPKATLESQLNVHSRSACSGIGNSRF